MDKCICGSELTDDQKCSRCKRIPSLCACPSVIGFSYFIDTGFDNLQYSEYGSDTYHYNESFKYEEDEGSKR